MSGPKKVANATNFYTILLYPVTQSNGRIKTEQHFHNFRNFRQQSTSVRMHHPRGKTNSLTTRITPENCLKALPTSFKSRTKENSTMTTTMMMIHSSKTPRMNNNQLLRFVP
ncbi:hypothetical protein CEXT_718991 [Caerostris extrusa]|uniref:Uncharacterized protein n=1 Tax=Caerostris extrusa TaxID=172846 RepID=A0AAV4V494_CAEEX|nr:hypothetical protein CEXT_718991 [Caerostris extrusa]